VLPPQEAKTKVKAKTQINASMSVSVFFIVFIPFSYKTAVSRQPLAVSKVRLTNSSRMHLLRSNNLPMLRAT
jgi:hypothetical protein